jgi:hypothetical protein
MHFAKLVGACDFNLSPGQMDRSRKIKYEKLLLTEPIHLWCVDGYESYHSEDRPEPTVDGQNIFINRGLSEFKCIGDTRNRLKMTNTGNLSSDTEVDQESSALHHQNHQKRPERLGMKSIHWQVLQCGQ